MIDHDVRELLARRASALDTEQPERLARLHARIRAARRRRTAAALASGALVVVTVATLGAVAIGGDSGGPDPAGPARGAESRTDPPAPAPGRWALTADGTADDSFPTDTRHALLVQQEHGGDGLPGPILAAIRLD